MQLPRWNNCKNSRTRGKTAQPSISHSGQGLEGKKSSSLPVEGGIFSLTFPFIDQAITLRTRSIELEPNVRTQEVKWAVSGRATDSRSPLQLTDLLPPSSHS